MCQEQCYHSSDGDCDDGGPGAEYGACGYGMDCADCGTRALAPPSPSPPPVPFATYQAFHTNSRADSGEEHITTGGMYLTSSDLELPFDGSTQQVIGIVFSSVDVDTTSTIANSHLGTIAATLESQD